MARKYAKRTYGPIVIDGYELVRVAKKGTATINHGLLHQIGVGNNSFIGAKVQKVNGKLCLVLSAVKVSV